MCIQTWIKPLDSYEFILQCCHELFALVVWLCGLIVEEQKNLRLHYKYLNSYFKNEQKFYELEMT